MKRSILAIATAAVLALASPAQASPYEFDYSGTSASTGGFSAMLLLDIPSDGSVATFMMGFRNGVQITGLSDYAGADNAISFSYPYVDINGLAYSTADGTSFDVYYDGTGIYELSGTGDITTVDPVTSANLIPVGVPEPMSLALLGSGLVAVSMLRLKRGAA